jgi:hypothetical protein
VRAIQPARGRWAGIFAATAFACSLVITVLLLALTGLFEDEENRRTILVWVALPVVLTFASWLSVQSGHAALRAVVWLSVVFIAFFIWIAAFSIGPYYLPVVILLMLAGSVPNRKCLKSQRISQDGAKSRHWGRRSLQGSRKVYGTSNPRSCANLNAWSGGNTRC